MTEVTATGEQMLQQDIQEFREARQRLSREIGILDTEARMGRVFNMAAQLADESGRARTIQSKSGDNPVTVDISEVRVGWNRNSGSGIKDNARVIVRNQDGTVANELVLHRGHDQEKWTADYLDHNYSNGQDGQRRDDYIWRKSEGSTAQFNAEQVFDKIPEIKQVETVLAQVAPQQ